MHREDIKAALRKKFGTLLAFERGAGLPKGCVKDVLRGRAVARAEAAVALALNKPLHVVFPRRYSGESSAEVDNTSRKRDAQRQIVRAA
jgi:lambda repressor-like predicted transcriptional regulator